jgi:hypothetical protein
MEIILNHKTNSLAASPRLRTAFSLFLIMVIMTIGVAEISSVNDVDAKKNKYDCSENAKGCDGLVYCDIDDSGSGGCYDRND